jgi:hypothetical protein
MSIYEWIAVCLLCFFLVYIGVRMFSKAIFRSYFETKGEFNNDKPKPKGGEVK